MIDLKEEFRALDQLDAPDLWPEAERRRPGMRPPSRQRHRIGAAALAFAVAAAGIGFAVWAFGGAPRARQPKPAATVENGLIAYVRGNAWDATLNVVEPDGSNPSRLLPGTSPAWSPDGATLAFVQESADETPRYLATISADGTAVERLEPLAGRPGGIGPQAWSPDGTQLVFASQDGIYVMNADGTGVRRVTRYEGDHACFDLHPSWSPDASTIAFAVMCEGGNEGLWTVAIDGSARRQLIAGDYESDEYRSPVWSPDGTRVAFVKTDWRGNDPIKNASIYVTNADGTAETRVAEGAAFDRSLAWSPDGRAIAFTGYHEGGSDIFLVDLETREVTQLTQTGDAVDPAWQPIPPNDGTPSPTPSATECTQATASGDFDGDGTTDQAEFLEIVSGSVSCDRGGEVFKNLASQDVVVRFGSGQTLEQPFTDCQGGLCAYVFEALDLDGDGRDELAVDVSSGGAIGLVEFYRIDRGGIRPLVIAQPGDPPYVEPGPAILGGGFDSGLQSPIVCRVRDDGTREIVSIHAQNVGDSLSGPWKVHTTTMVLQDEQFVVTATNDEESSFPGTSGIPGFSETAPLDNLCS